MTLAFRDVTCARGGRVLFEKLSFTLGAGDAAVVVGPNGVGKSSLIRIAAGLLAPVAGDVEVEGTRALLAESAALDPERTVADALGFWAALDDAPESVARVTAALSDIDLSHLADIPVRLLSTGQRRRIAFARVLASGAAIWLLDEPANGLDTAATARLEMLIARHRGTGGLALVATHLPLAIPDSREITLEPAP